MDLNLEEMFEIFDEADPEGVKEREAAARAKSNATVSFMVVKAGRSSDATAVCLSCLRLQAARSTRSRSDRKSCRLQCTGFFVYGF